MATTLTYCMILIIVVDFIFEEVLERMNHKRWQLPIPAELKDVYAEKEYAKAFAYSNDKRKVEIISSYFQIVLTVLVLYFCWLGKLQNYIAELTESPYYQAFIFFSVYAVVNLVLSLPFSIYNTFVIEEKYGFNKTTVKTFVIDIFKGTLVGAIIGGVLLSAVIAFYLWSPQYFWIYAWILFALFSIFMAMFYTSLLVPIFNKLTPLEEGSLKEVLNDLGLKTGFPLHEIYVIDGSKRSTKANAYFSGIGPKKTIVLYDTLIEKLSEQEIVSVMAHEIGHYKNKHVMKSLVISLIQMGLMLWILSLCIHLPAIHEALGAKQPAFHIGLIAFSLLYSPLNMLSEWGMNWLSRKNEFEADAYAKTWSNGIELIGGLKKLHHDSLSNINPHPYYVFFHYSHPTLLHRIQAIQQ